MIGILDELQRCALAEPLDQPQKQIKHGELVAAALQKQRRDLDREKMLATLVRRPSRRMQGKAEEGEAADAGQGRCGLRLRSHAAAEGLAAGDQRKRGASFAAAATAAR